MNQPLTVAHRSGQLAYPTWAAHTTNCPAPQGSGQADQGMRVPLLDLNMVVQRITFGLNGLHCVAYRLTFSLNGLRLVV